METFDNIFIFKTNICTEYDKQRLQSLLDGHDAIEQWNVDLDDEDYVLRVISCSLDHQKIINLINTHGYQCCELT
jgi:hypothetical protein